MKVHLSASTEQYLSEFEQDTFELSLASEALYYGAIAMFVTSLGKCTYAVLESYALRLDIEPDNIQTQLNWDFGSNPTVIRKIDMKITWPELPESRKKAVARAAHKCTIHTTIKQCVDITVSVNGS